MESLIINNIKKKQSQLPTKKSNNCICHTRSLETLNVPLIDIVIILDYIEEELCFKI